MLKHLPHGARGPGRRDGGYVMALFGLVLIVLVAFAGIGIDIAAWYARAAEMQRGADAAALAGAAQMPNFTSAKSAALTTAAKNGFVPGGNIEITVTAVSDYRVKVVISDSKVPQYFSRSFRGDVDLTRTAVAEFVQPIPLGSPRNELGSGNTETTNPENMWLAVSGYCAARENGDLKLSKYDNSYSRGNLSCGGTVSGDYDPDGYVYAIDVPVDMSGSLYIQVYDAEFSSSSSIDSALKSGASITTTYVVRGLDTGNGSAATWKDNPVVTSVEVPSGSSTYLNRWKQIAALNNPRKGQYFIQVYTKAGEYNSYGSNQFALRASTSSSTASPFAARCTTIPGDAGYSATCPQVHGYVDMSIMANLEGTKASFYLAQVDSSNAGKKLRINLFDPGEGAQTIEILDPNGNPATVSWTTDCVEVRPARSCSGTGTEIDVSGTGSQPGSNMGGNGPFNDRTLVITTNLPANYVGKYGTKTWWRVRYTVGSAPTDRTTWSARVLGDPVHLVYDK